MATLLNMGSAHSYLHSSNVTMAAEIVDVGTIGHYSAEKIKDLIQIHHGVRRAHLKDMRDIAYDLRYLLGAGTTAELHTGKREDLARVFMDGFSFVLNSSQAQAQETDPVKARAWMQKIIDTVIVQRENLHSLSYHDVEDWDIEI